ncbi:hypothetical protein GCM10027047_35580 [Rhodococcus aerolatus]
MTGDSKFVPSDEQRAKLARMKADQQRLIDSGAPSSTLSTGKQEFGIGTNPDGTLNLVDPTDPRPDRRSRDAGRGRPPRDDTAEP